jgi:hypothetical protein
MIVMKGLCCHAAIATLRAERCRGGYRASRLFMKSARKSCSLPVSQRETGKRSARAWTASLNSPGALVERHFHPEDG